MTRLSIKMKGGVSLKAELIFEKGHDDAWP